MKPGEQSDAARLREELRWSEQRLAAITAATHEGVWEREIATGNIVWSPRTYEIHGFAPGSFEPTFARLVELTHPDDRERFLVAVRAHLDDQQPFSQEIRFRRPDGSFRLLLTRGAALRDANGIPTRVVGTIRDITDQKRAEEALRRENAFRQLIISGAAEGICVHHDIDAPPFIEFTVWNERMTDITGYALDEINKIGWVEAVYPDAASQAAARERIERARQGDDLRANEVVLTRKNGERRTVLLSARLLPSQEHPRQSLVLLYDITDRKRAEDELSRANQRLLIHLEQTPLAMIECDLHGNVLRWSGPAEKLFGWTADEFVGCRLAESLIHPDDVGIVRERLQRLSNGTALSTQGINRNVCKDGNWVTCEWYTSAIRNERGQIESILAFAHDITQQQRAEEAVRESQRTLFTLLGNLPGMAYRLRNDTHWTIEFVSERCRDLTGYAPEELVGNKVLSFNDLIFHEDRAPVRVQVDAALKLNQPFELRYRIVTRDGAIKWVWERGSAVPATADGALRLEGFITDITSQKRLEEELRQSQKMESIGRLAGGVAHDFNNMLTVIQGHSLLISDTPGLPESAGDSVKEIAVAVERAANLTRQLLTFSRRQVMQRRDLDLNDVVSDALKMLGRLLGEDIALEFSASGHPALVRGDSGMLQQVIMNLAVNSRDAMPDGGKLTLRIRYCPADDPAAKERLPLYRGAIVLLEVADTGAGISAQHLPRIFEPFFTTKDIGKGTGLGLATVYAIVEQHGGRITVESEIGKGTQFTIALPALLIPGAPRQDKRGAIPMRGGTETILVVEDEPPLLALACQVLENLGYKIIVASSGAVALQVWKEHGKQVDLLLTDLVMPDGISGRQLDERLREMRPALKTIYTSGYSPDLMGKDFVLQHGQSFLQKPYSPGELARIVRERLDAR